MSIKVSRSVETSAPSAGDTQPGESSLFDAVDLPVQNAGVVLTSGRRVELSSESTSDRIIVRSRAGDVVLAVEVGDSGPVLRFSGASLELASTDSLHLVARDVSIDAHERLELKSAGSMTESVRGDHHRRVGGDERIEAARVEIQANEEAVRVRARGKVALDGEHIGLNDEACLEPFAWSVAAAEEAAEEAE